MLKYSSSRILHDDHMATIALLSEVERVVLSRQAPPVQSDQETGRFIDRLCKTLNGEISGHFDFEEDSVFPALAEYGMADLGDLLVEEHHAIRKAMNDVVASAGAESGIMILNRICQRLNPSTFAASSISTEIVRKNDARIRIANGRLNVT